jgi:putative ATP-dependent endonuclease of OLD family
LKSNTQKGAGLLLHAIIDNFETTKNDGQSFLNYDHVEELKKFINATLSKIKIFNLFSINATISPDTAEMLSTLFYLSDGKRKIESTGSGTQYLTMALINILCQILELYQRKSIKFSEHLYTNAKNENILPLVLSIDEPEIHLNPYLQRSFINYLRKIMKNEDAEFKELLRLLFKIDGIDGQLIIATHSPEILAGEYYNLIRFYRNKKQVIEVASGMNLIPNIKSNNDDKMKINCENTLYSYYFDMKEAFFSKCAIVVEGKTESACIPIFANTLDFNLDDLGICVIVANGKGQISPICDVLELFGIGSVSIYDRDDNNDARDESDKYYTKYRDFEVEIVTTALENNKEILPNIVNQLYEKNNDIQLSPKKIKQWSDKLFSKNISINIESPLDFDKNSDEEIILFYTLVFKQNKNIVFARMIGKYFNSDLIPDSYKNAIRRATEKAKNV